MTSLLKNLKQKLKTYIKTSNFTVMMESFHLGINVKVHRVQG